MATDPNVLDSDPVDPPANDPPAPPANDPPAGDPPADPPAAFTLPEDFDWRTHWSGGDDKLLKLAGRYQSPKALLEATAQLRAKLSTGKAIEPLTDDSTDEEKAAYRKVMAIPDEADGYLKTLPEGYVIGDDDKPYADVFIKDMHGVNAPAPVVNAALAAYDKIRNQQLEEQSDLARETEQMSIEQLRSEWGGDYKRNLNAMGSYLDTMPPEVANVFKFGTLPLFNDKGQPTGKSVPIGFKAEVVKWLVGQAIEANPLATVVPGAGANQASAVADELASIKAKMGTPAYAKDEKMQARYRELLTAQETINRR